MNEAHRLQEVGIVKESKDYFIALEGLPSAKVNDFILDQNGKWGLVVGLEDNIVEAILLEAKACEPGVTFFLAEGGLGLPGVEGLLGRVINPLGKTIDQESAVAKTEQFLELEKKALGISARRLITNQLETGITLVDTLLPIGKGQRELVFGDPRSGKTSFLLDVIANQSGKDVICIYAALGKQEAEISRFVENIQASGASKHTVIVASSSNDPVPLITLTPAVAFGIAEEFCLQGKDVLLVLDDLGTHAKYLREIALLAGKIPGRESYPGDVFYQHAQLMERAGAYNQENGGGTITLLPVIETTLENFTSLIPTNLMSSTDGHLLFLASTKAQGFYPPIQVDGSVTRVGRQTQFPLQKELSFKVQTALARYSQLEKYTRFGTDLTAETQSNIKKGQLLRELIKQDRLDNVPLETQILLLGLVFSSFFDQRNIDFLKRNKKVLISTLTSSGEFTQLKEALRGELGLPELLEKLEAKLSILSNLCH